MSEQRKSPRSATIVSGALIDEKKKSKCLRKEISKALDSEVKTEYQDKILRENSRLVKIIERQKRGQKKQIERLNEVRDSADVLDKKCAQLTRMIEQSSHCVVYTGAGISTAANIPDYRGTGGVWTAISKGNKIKECNLVTATPTTAHMALATLVKAGVVKYVLSQNCDGLHLRSGITEGNLSEIHGNMYLENCAEGHKIYRLFDVTEKTNLRKHKTGRICPICQSELYDSIVHFGELNHFNEPYRWENAESHVGKADLIITLGTSLKVLKGYKHLWPKEAKLVIVNLQWTPKDKQADLIINGECDFVLDHLATHFGVQPVPEFKYAADPLLDLATCLSDTDLPPKTPMIDSVLRVPSGFTVEKRLHKTNQAEHYTPGWFGKGLKK